MKLYIFKYLVINIVLFYVLRFSASLVSLAHGPIEGEYPSSPYMEIALAIQLIIIGLFFYKDKRKKRHKKANIHQYIVVFIIMLFIGRHFGVISNYYMP